MFIRLLESKNIILSSIFIVLLIFVAFFIAGIPKDSLSLISYLMYLGSVLLSFYIIQESEIVKNPFYVYFIICAFSIVFSNAIQQIQITSSLLFSTSAYFLLNDALSKNKSFVVHSFEIGIFLSVSVFIFLPSILFLIAIPFFILFYLRDGLNALVMMLLGVLIFTLTSFQLAYLFELDFLGYLLRIIQIRPLELSSELFYYIPFIVFFLFIFILYPFRTNVFRKYVGFHYTLLVLYISIWSCILYFYAGKNYDWMIVFYFPVSFFLSRFIEKNKNLFVRELLIWFLMLTLISIFYHKYLNAILFPAIWSGILEVIDFFRQIPNMSFDLSNLPDLRKLLP